MTEQPQQNGPLPIALYATVVAHKAYFSRVELPTLLSHLGVPLALWTAADEFWLEQIGSAIHKPVATILATFGNTFTAVRRELDQRQPSLDDLERLVTPPAVGRDFNPVEETALALATVDEDALPFVAPALAAPPPPQAGTMPPAPDAGETQEVSILGPGLLAALPFSRGRGTELSRMSLSQYASLHAELGAQPQARADILGRYALTEETCAELDTAWRERFAAHSEDQQRFGELVSLYGSWLRGTEPAGGR